MPAAFPELAGLVAGFVLAWVLATWLLSLALRDASIMDIAWGPGFLGMVVVGVVAGPAGDSPRAILLLVLVGLWALRLALHIGVRNHGKGEDPRYAQWREDAGGGWWYKSLGKVFLLQGALMFAIGLPFAWLLSTPAAGGPVGWLDLVATLVWAVGMFWEVGGDWQLLRFQREGSGGVLDEGLWGWTRHPNYFGEFTLWWGYGLIVLAAPWGWAGLYAPALMAFLLLRVSGVTMTERRQVDTKPKYRDYIERVPAFFPRPPGP